MIEKLKTINPYDETEIDMDTNSVAGLVYENTPLVQKINELVDAVNALVYENDKDSDWYDGRTRLKNVQDKFAEQRKWIGKLCWVWDDDGDERTFTKLKEIIEDDDDRPFKCFSRWKHCEPVKPDDDIIYKGE